MASAVQTQKLFSRFKIEVGPHVPTNTAALVASGLSYVDLRDYDGFAVVTEATTVAGTGVNLVEIVAATDSNGTNATVIKTSAALVLNTNALYDAQECTAEEIAEIGRAAGLALRYVAARLTCDNSGSRASTTYIRGPSKSPHLNLTAGIYS